MRQSELEACRDIAQVALEVDAFGLIVIEYLYRKIVQPNHRSINLNKTIHQAMSNIDIILYDYLIVGIDQFYSFKQENTINF
jgi:DNA repair protein RadC